MPVKDFIEQSLEYGDIIDSNIFYKINKSNNIFLWIRQDPKYFQYWRNFKYWV